ncbi:MAG: MBL fold metallo-hydrolase [Patescibacteria group bacterium]
MVITYYGLSCFKISSGEFILAFDPPSKKSSFKSPRFRADAVLISHAHVDHSGHDQISGKENAAPVKIDGPGEYEIRGVDISGIPSWHDEANGKKLGSNTIYSAELENIKICHLGDFGEKELRNETLEAIGPVDILFLPIGGKTVIDAEAASKIANQLEPKIIIPMHYEKKELAVFLKESGIESSKPEEKLTVKKKELAEDKTRVVILKPSIQ